MTPIILDVPFASEEAYCNRTAGLTSKRRYLNKRLNCRRKHARKHLDLMAHDTTHARNVFQLVHRDVFSSFKYGV